MTRAVFCLGTLVCLVFSSGCRTKQSSTRLSDGDRELIRQADVAFAKNALALAELALPASVDSVVESLP